jgi:hypothetical protein
MLDRLVRVELREIWETEAQDFTPWIADKENINILGDALNMELELKALEKSVGPFSADILCTNTDDDSLVLIKNQLEKTDHTHLGQLMTYAAGLHTVNIVWIAAKFTDEHRAALDWLNEITDVKFRFFGLEVELWRIGESKPAPKFNVVCKPNDWSRAVKRNSNDYSEAELTPAKSVQLSFWIGLKNHIDANSKVIRAQQPRPQHWTNFSIGKSGSKLVALINTLNKTVGVSFQTFDEGGKFLYDNLLNQKDEIEAELGFELNWDRLDGKIATRISHFKHADLNNKQNWDNHFKWILEHLEKLNNAFRNRIKKASDPSG